MRMGAIVRRAGVMAIVLEGGEVRPGDAVRVVEPAERRPAPARLSASRRAGHPARPFRLRVVSLPNDLAGLLKDRAICYLATTMPDGSPQLTLTWADTDGEHILINTVVGHQKTRNVRRDPRVVRRSRTPPIRRITSQSADPSSS